MNDVLSDLHANLSEWADNARRRGWLTRNALTALEESQTATPGALFDSAERPLVAGLFGGTGVGKSTLMNRLAGEDVARTSAERPTSRDITVYVHRSVTVDHLPAEFPMERMRTSLHQNDRYRSVLWIDMPDFDSVEQSHRDLVEHWLPHLDVVLYVVSPERYRDDQGWRLLLEHGRDHAWLFVINHWDRGDPVQRDDFHQLLTQAGFKEPMLFCTDSGPTGGSDDFAALQNTLDQLTNQQLVQQLEARGVLQRVRQLTHTVNELTERMGPRDGLTQLQERWSAQWSTDAAELARGTDWSCSVLSESFADQEGSWLTAWLPRKARLAASVAPALEQMTQADTPATHHEGSGVQSTSHPEPAPGGSAAGVIDGLLLDRIDESIHRLVQSGADLGMPAKALTRAFGLSAPGSTEGSDPSASTDNIGVAQAAHHWASELRLVAQQALHQSLAKPGNRGQRLVHRGLGVLATILPLLAMGWVAYTLVNGFRLGGAQAGSYLGANFAIHSVLLIGLAWLLPAFLRRKLRPSRQAAALRGLKQGVQDALVRVDDKVQAVLETTDRERDALHLELTDLLNNARTPEQVALPPLVQRMLSDGVSGDPQTATLSSTHLTASGVRATTHNDTSAAPVS